MIMQILYMHYHENMTLLCYLCGSLVFLQDSVSLLENMTVISKNPAYYTHALDQVLLKELSQKLIAQDKLHLLEEIGEGAFGKVFKGNNSKGIYLCVLV